MSKLLVKPSGTEGRVVDVTPQSAGWTYVGFALHKLKPGETVTGGEATREAIVVGDAVADVLMGRQAGVALSVGVLTGVTTAAEFDGHADVVVGSLVDVVPA